MSSAALLLSSTDAESALAFLQTANSGGASILSDVADLLSSGDAPDDLIAAAIRLKQTAFTASQRTAPSTAASLTSDTQRRILSATSAAARRIRNVATAPSDCQIPPIADAQQTLGAVGINISADTALVIQDGFLHVANTFGVRNVRLWGRVHTLRGQYYIMETRRAAVDRALPAPLKSRSELSALSRTEAAAFGANEYAYFVSDGAADWIALDDVTPNVITASRRVHRLFTGELSSRHDVGGALGIISEAELLRAVVARISHSTILAPRGALTVDEAFSGVERAVDDAAFECPTESELTDAETAGGAWVFARRQIMRNGRCEKFVVPEIESADEEDAEAGNEEASDDPAPLLTAVADASASSGETAVPPLFSYHTSERAHPHSILYARSLQWDGAVTAVVNGKVSAFYNGFGVKRLQTPFTPTTNSAPQIEWAPPPAEEESDEQTPFTGAEQNDPTPPQNPETAANEDGEDNGGDGDADAEEADGDDADGETD